MVTAYFCGLQGPGSNATRVGGSDWYSCPGTAFGEWGCTKITPPQLAMSLQPAMQLPALPLLHCCMWHTATLLCPWGKGKK